eukprot:492349_1
MEDFLDLEAGGAVFDASNHGEVDRSLEKSPRPCSRLRTNYVVIGFLALLVITTVLSGGLYLYGYFSTDEAIDQTLLQQVKPLRKQSITQQGKFLRKPLIMQQVKTPMKPPITQPAKPSITQPVKQSITQHVEKPIT